MDILKFIMILDSMIEKTETEIELAKEDNDILRQASNLFYWQGMKSGLESAKNLFQYGKLPGVDFDFEDKGPTIQ